MVSRSALYMVYMFVRLLVCECSAVLSMLLRATFSITATALAFNEDRQQKKKKTKRVNQTKESRTIQLFIITILIIRPCRVITTPIRFEFTIRPSILLLLSNDDLFRGRNCIQLRDGETMAIKRKLTDDKLMAIFWCSGEAK